MMLKAFLFSISMLFTLSISGQYYGLVTTVPGGDAYDADYQAVIDYANSNTITLPSTANQGCQNDLIVNLKNDGLYDHLEILYAFAGAGNEDFANLNFIDPGNHTVTENGTVNYSTLDGYEKNGTNNTDYLNTHWNPSDDCVNCAQNDISAGGWFILDSDPTANGQFYYYFGAATSGQGVGLAFRNVGTVTIWNNVSGSTTQVGLKSGANSGYMYQCYRNNATQKFYQEDDDAEVQANNNSGAETSNDFYIFSLNVGSALGSFQGFGMGLFYVGDHTGTASDYDLMYDHVNTYMNCISN